MSKNTHSAYKLHIAHILIWVCVSTYVLICCMCVCFFFSVWKLMRVIIYTLCYTATESCHKLWPYACPHFADAHYEFVSTCSGLWVFSACMRACVYVCACVWKSIYDTWTLWPQHLSLLGNRGHQQRDNAAVLSNMHIQYTVYIQTDCEGKIINILSHTLEYGGTTDTLWEPCILNGYIWLL